jgi:hypothetical protein
MHIVLPSWRWLPLMFFAMVSPATVAMAGELAGSEWRPNQIGAAAVSSEAELFVQFKGEGELSGHGGCNGFFGQYEISQNTIRIWKRHFLRPSKPRGPSKERTGASSFSTPTAKSRPGLPRQIGIDLSPRDWPAGGGNALSDLFKRKISRYNLL